MKDRTIEMTFEIGPSGALEAHIGGGPSGRASEPGFALESLAFTADFALALARAVERRLVLGDIRVFASFPEALSRPSLAMAISSALEAHGIARHRFRLFLWHTPREEHGGSGFRSRLYRADLLSRKPRRRAAAPDDAAPPSPGALRALSAPERRTDLALHRTEPEDQGWLNKDTCLRPGARYRLRVIIGDPLPGSLMVTPPPPTDPLLPPPTGVGHELHVMVHGEDFTLEGASVARLLLADQGASAPVDFLVRAPERVGAARLYVAIAHRGNVLQSFVLNTSIDTAESALTAEPRLFAQLLFSSTERFSNLAELRDRALSIGVGEPRPGATTPLRLAGPTSCGALHLAEPLPAQQIAAYRRILEEATFEEGKEPRFLASPSVKNPQRPGAEEVLRKLAILGSSLYRSFYLQADTVRSTLDELTQAENRTIQIIRQSAAQTLPWAALYDFPAPEEVMGRPAPVCLGDARCGCPSPDRWCARGFWGVRHHVEELIGTGALEDAVLTVERRETAPIGLALGTHDRSALGLLVKVNQLVAPASALELDLDKDLLETLWRPDRPAILVVLGPMAVADAEGEPPGPRIVLRPGQRWLQDKAVVDFCRSRGRWAQPRSLVMVLASTADAAPPATVTDLMLAFHSAGAGAVIGTECAVFPGLLSRFAAEVTGALLRGESLGAALTGFRRLLLREHNPLGFVFTAIGSADLTLAPA